MDLFRALLKEFFVYLLITLFLLLGECGIWAIRETKDWYHVLAIALGLLIMYPAFLWWYSFLKSIFK